MIIPHDHHLSDSIAFQEDNCPESNSKTHHTGFPIHCHVCNELTSEKAVTLVLIRNIQNNYFVTDWISQLNGFKSISFESICIDIESHPFKSEVTDLSLLRAPPSLS
jgi:hypothetical protein